MGLAILATEQPRPAPRAPKPSETAPKAPEKPPRAKTEYQKAKIVTVESGKDLGVKFNLLSNTENTFIETIQHFYDMFSEMPNASGWPAEFVKEFKRRYPDVNKDNFKTKAEEFVRTNEGVVFAVKLAEWELATIQGATRAQIKAVQKPEERYISRVQVSEAPEEAGEISIHPPKGLFRKRMAESDQLNKALGEERGALKGRSASQKDRRFYYQAIFGSGDLRYDDANLTSIQKDYLDSIRRRGRTLTGQDAEAEKTRLSQRLIAITEARLDFYTASGKAPGTIELNTIEANGRYRRGLMQRAHLQVEETAVGTLRGRNADVRSYIEREITILEQDLKKTNSERVGQVLKQEAGQNTKAVVGQEITKLREDYIITEAEKLKAQQLGEQIEDLRGDLEAAKARKSLEEEKQKIADESELVRKQLIEIGHRAVDQQFDIIKARDEEIPQLTEDISYLEGQRQEAQREVDALKVSITAITAEREQKIREAKGAAAKTDDLDRRLKDAQDRLISLTDQLTGNTQSGMKSYLEKIRDAKIQKERLDRLVKDPRIKPFFDKLDALGAADASKQVELLGQLDIESKYQSEKTPAETVAAYLERRIKELEGEKYSLENPDIGRSYKKEDYELYQSEILEGNKEEEIRKRAEAATVNDPDSPFPLQYGEIYSIYKESYLRVAQIMFGKDVTLPGKDNQERFEKVTKLLTPEKLVEIYNTSGLGQITEISDIGPDQVDTQFIDKILAALQKEAKLGTLGDISPQDKALLREATVAKPDEGYSPDKQYISDLEQTLYYFRDINDLTVRIMKARGVTDPSQLTKEEVARIKKEAEEVDLLRKRRLSI